jgi:hypothetical protein
VPFSRIAPERAIVLPAQIAKTGHISHLHRRNSPEAIPFLYKNDLEARQALPAAY